MLTDETLYLRLLNGDMEAFEQLYRRYETRLFGYIVRQLGDRIEAEDVFHDAFMAVLKERKSGQELSNFRAWLFQVARNLCHNRFRSSKRAARTTLTESRSKVPGVDAEHMLDSQQMPQALRGAVARLPESLAQLYSLRASGLSLDEIAETLDIPLGTVKSRMHKMVMQLREEMRQWIAT